VDPQYTGPTEADLAALDDAVQEFDECFLGMAPTLGTLAAVMTPAALWALGHQAGEDGKPRDWEMPDDWHRGYLRGKRAFLARRMKHHASPT
jgi:hypothetical protein